MSYRLHTPPTDKRGHLRDLSRQSVIEVDNGTISRIMIPCSYRNETYHDRPMHDHLGWPSPDSRDMSCQLPPGCDRLVVLDDINLLDEGYSSVTVSFVDPPDGLTASGDIDNGCVNLTLSVMCQSVVSDDVEVPFAAYVTGTFGDGYENEEPVQLRDVVTKGIVRISAGPIS